MLKAGCGSGSAAVSKLLSTNLTLTMRFHGSWRCVKQGINNGVRSNLYNAPSSFQRGFSSTSSFPVVDEHHKDLREMLRAFVKREVEPQAKEFDKKEEFNLDLFRKLGTKSDDGLGILGLTIDEEYGGAGLDPLSLVIAHEELSYSDPAFCLSFLAHSVLFAHNLFINGSNEQRKRWLPGACDGTLVGGMCMSEPDAGTDVLGMKTNAKYDEGIESFIINGTKMWITNGTIDDGTNTGDVFLVYAKTGPKRTDITQFVVERDTPGFTVGQKIDGKCGMRASNTAELVFEDVVIPAQTHVVGNVNGATLCMMRNLEIERIALAAMSLGIARRCIDVMVDYSQTRKTYGKPIHEYGQIQNYIARSYAGFMAGRCYVYDVARAIDMFSSGNGLNADGVKLFCAPMAERVAYDAMQTLGGNGYISDYVVERLWRDSRLLEIGGGTNESHHKNIVRDLRKGDRLD